MNKSIKLLLLVCALFTATISNAAEMVNINKADAATLIANLKGIGEVKARAIVSYRKKNGPYRSIDDLTNVKGIGEGLVKKNKKYLGIGKGVSSTTSSAVAAKKKDTTGKSSAKSKDQKKDGSKGKSKSSAKSDSKSTTNKSSTAKTATDKKKSSNKKKTTTDKKKKKKKAATS